MNYLNIIYYIISIASIFLYVLSVQFKDKKNILITQIFASMCYLIVYIIIGAHSGVAIEIIEEIKGYTFLKIESKNKKIPLFVLIIFILLLVLASIVFYDGLLSLLPLIINILLFISTYKSPKHIRWVMLICGIMWAIYNFYVGAYIIIVGNILEVISAIIALIKFKNEK